MDMTIGRRLHVTVGLVAACLLAGGIAWAGTGATVATPGVPETVSAQDDDRSVSVAGRVATVDRAGDTIAIEGVDRQLKIDSSTDVTRNGSPASFADLQEGEQVRAAFEDGFPAHVRQIDIMSPTRSPGTALPRQESTPSDLPRRETIPSDLPRHETNGEATSTGPSPATR